MYMVILVGLMHRHSIMLTIPPYVQQFCHYPHTSNSFSLPVFSLLPRFFGLISNSICFTIRVIFMLLFTKLTQLILNIIQTCPQIVIFVRHSCATLQKSFPMPQPKIWAPQISECEFQSLRYVKSINSKRACRSHLRF